jgi:hypothetical protein
MGTRLLAVGPGKTTVKLDGDGRITQRLWSRADIVRIVPRATFRVNPRRYVDRALVSRVASLGTQE